MDVNKVFTMNGGTDIFRGLIQLPWSYVGYIEHMNILARLDR